MDQALYLVGPMGAAELLDGLVSAPRQLDGEMHSPPLVDGISGCMQTDACAGRIRHNRHQLLAPHE